MKSGKVCLCFLVLCLSLVSFCAPTENKEPSPEDEQLELLKAEELAKLSDLKDLKTDEVALEDFEEEKTFDHEPFEELNRDKDELDQGDDVKKSDVDDDGEREQEKHELEVEEVEKLTEQETKMEGGGGDIKEYSFEDMVQERQEETQQDEEDEKDVDELADTDIVAVEDLEGEDKEDEKEEEEEEEKKKKEGMEEEEEEETVMQFKEAVKVDTKLDPKALPPPKVSSFEPIPMPTDFESYDTDKNDFIDIEELVAVTGAWENVLEAFKVCDKNDDDLIDRKEFRQAPWDLAGKPPTVV